RPQTAGRRRGTGQGPDVRRRPGGPADRAAEPAAGRPGPRGGTRTRPADREGRPVRARAADGATADAHRRRGAGGAGAPDRRAARGQRGGPGRMTKHISHWIGGKPWTGEADRHGDVYNPATGQVTGQVDFANGNEVNAAVAAAAQALPGWRATSL